MKIVNFISFTFIILAYVLPLQGQVNDDYEKFKQKEQQSYESFKKQEIAAFKSFRDSVNNDYANFLKQRWEEMEAMQGISKPKEPQVPPVVYMEENEKEESVETSIAIYYEIVIPIVEPEPQPKPVQPVIEVPQQVEPRFDFPFFNADCSVRLGDSHRFTLNSCDETAISDAWKHLSTELYNNLLFDCLAIRDDLNLCDWAYLEMLNSMATSFFGQNSNEATLLTAFLFCQSGYKMRLARNSEKLYMLYACNHQIYDEKFFNIQGVCYYVYNADVDRMYIADVQFSGEQTMSLWMNNEQLLKHNESEERHLSSKRYDAEVTVSVNKNLVDFYATYPTGVLDANICSRWAMYANVPMSESVKKQVYPSLKSAIAGKTQLEAANLLLNFVQTAFVYEYDDNVWGEDRVFFAEETLFYPYCDCEDRSILFSRLVRDLLSLDVVLVYYPGHLATAVAFTTDVYGDYIVLDNVKYTVCDPTYINAPVGCTMPDMDNAQAKIILLKNK